MWARKSNPNPEHLWISSIVHASFVTLEGEASYTVWALPDKLLFLWWATESLWRPRSCLLKGKINLVDREKWLKDTRIELNRGWSLMTSSIETRDENGRERSENVLTIPALIFFCREREGRTEKRNRYYGISGTEYFERERVDYDREAVKQNGNINICNHLKQWARCNNSNHMQTSG